VSHTFQITLRRDGHDLAVVTTTAGDADVMVGRSHVCALRIPQDDMSVSGTHATFSWKGGHLLLTDAQSRNGVYFQGRRLTRPHRVGSGDIYAIGGCSLAVAKLDARRQNQSAKPHRLERLNGYQAGKTVDIVPRSEGAPFSIGLDPGSSVVLADMLVSRHHAELVTRENGECWIRDLNSRNGTFVNGDPLRGKERLLKNNDKISIAYFDFRFLDRAFRHSRFHVWMKLGALAVTLGLGGFAYTLWTMTSATTQDCIRLCRSQAAIENFVMSRQALTNAKMARDAGKFTAEIAILEDQLQRWENTCSNWKNVQTLLSEGDFRQARKALEPLVTLTLDDWSWSGATAIGKRRLAEFAAELLRLDYECDDVLAAVNGSQPEEQADAIGRREKPLVEFLTREREHIDSEPCLSNIAVRLNQQRERMTGIRTSFEAVDKAIAALDDNVPNFKDLAQRLRQVEQDKTAYGAVRSYASKYRLPCAELGEARAFVMQETEDLIALRFDMIATNRESFRLPKKDLCARHPAFSAHRAKIEHQHERILSLAHSVESLIEGLSARGVENGTCDAALKRTLSTESWTHVLSFDCLEGRPPKPGRREPCGLYDELLGVEYTYQALRALPAVYNGLALRLVGFTPNVVDARRTFEQIDQFVDFLDKGPSFLRRGALGEFRDYGERLRGDRKTLIDYLSNYHGSSRAKLVATYYAAYFSGGDNPARRKAMAADFRAIQKSVSDLAEKYDVASDPVEQLALRAKIMSVGLPGDGALHSKWFEKFGGGTGK